MKRALSVLAAAVLAIGLTATVATSASARACTSGWFCAYDGANFTSELMRANGANNPAGTNNVYVQHDKVSSVSNSTANTWVGVNERTALPDTIVLYSYGYSEIGTPSSSWNNIIDHFDVR